MNGDPLPGGPYTSTQVVAWFATLAGLYFTREVWGQFGEFMNALVLLGVPILVGWAARWIPHDARNPVLIAAGWIRCFGAPPAGRVDGVRVRLRSPHRLRQHYVVDPRSDRVDPSLELRRSAPSRPRSRSESADRRGTSDGSTRPAELTELTDVQTLLAKRR